MTTKLFEIPEMRRRLSLFVSINTALSCLQVSKAFSEEFIPSIWHTIDFSTQHKFNELSPPIVAKYGRHIRVVKGIKDLKHVYILLHINLINNNLSEIRIHQMAGEINIYYDLIRRNQNTLSVLNIRNDAIVYGKLCINLDSLTSTMAPRSSKLTTLVLTRLTLTRSSFISVLRCCPSLKNINIWGTEIIHNNFTDDFQHEGVTTLWSKISGVLNPPEYPLLAHFPNLMTWTTHSDISGTEMKAISRWCPSLGAVKAKHTPTQQIILITTAFPSITKLTFDYKFITPDLILAITRRPRWVSISVYFNRNDDKHYSDGYYSQEDHFQSSSWMIQSIPCLCSNLETLYMPQHIMDMDDVEDTPWKCRNLKFLAVRIKGLDTKKVVDKTLMLLARGKYVIQTTGNWDTTSLGNSIEARVVRHLSQFPNLSQIWLGTPT
ncbi:hypothetical protein BGZ76_008681 [Entomortierella beljakovae]|nr:hypothetical protein BGZ76_008681 [Entomortierella beljakovae]